MSKTIKVTCDECGEPCGGAKHHRCWWHLGIEPMMEDDIVDYSPFSGGDFCSNKCAIAYLRRVQEEDDRIAEGALG